VTQTEKMTQMTHWPGDPVTQFHVWCRWYLIRGSRGFSLSLVSTIRLT